MPDYAEESEDKRIRKRKRQEEFLIIIHVSRNVERSYREKR